MSQASWNFAGSPTSKQSLQARPVYHHKRESIDEHLTIVFAALAVSHTVSTKLVGASRNLSAPHVAAAPSASKPDARSSPPQPTTRRSPRSHRQYRCRPCTLKSPKSGIIL